jgi:hypothetical protein
VPIAGHVELRDWHLYRDHLRDVELVQIEQERVHRR